MIVSSRSNPTVKQIRSLRHRKEREETGQFFAEGIRIVAEAVDLQAAIETCVVAPELLTSSFAKEIVEQLRSDDVPCLEVTADVFRSLSTKEGPQGIGVVVRQRWQSLEDSTSAGGLCWLVLDQVQDPGNLGTILRTSDAVGGTGVLLLGATADPTEPSAVRASMGAIFSQRLVRTRLEDLAVWKQRHGVFLVGTSDAAESDYQSVTYPTNLALFMGSERLGLSEEERSICDLMVRIPMVGRSDSLNLAVATGVMLYEIFNQRRQPGAS
jgi:RNA methyltransferase, TrmH family